MTNTKNILIADRYSDALVELAKEGRLTYEKISSDLNFIKDTLEQSKDLNDVLVNPVVSIENKKEIIDKVFSNDVDGLILNFLKVIVDKERFNTFYDICDSFSKARDSVENISRVQVVSAVEMNSEAQNKLKIKLEEKMKKNVVLDLKINPQIIAGLVISIGDSVIDMSLKHKLEDLSKKLG